MPSLPSAHAQEGYSTFLCVWVWVCLSVWAISAILHNKIPKKRHQHLMGMILKKEFLKCFVPKLWLFPVYTVQKHVQTAMCIFKLAMGVICA